MSRRKTYFDLILQNSKILNKKSTGNFLVSFFKNNKIYSSRFKRMPNG
jgi:hypothetical protein